MYELWGGVVSPAGTAAQEQKRTVGFQSKTYSLSDEVVAAIEDAKAKGESPNKFLRRMLIDARADSAPQRPRCEVCGIGLTSADLRTGSCPYCKQSFSEYPPEPAARDLVVELDGERG